MTSAHLAHATPEGLRRLARWLGITVRLSIDELRDYIAMVTTEQQGPGAPGSGRR